MLFKSKNHSIYNSNMGKSIIITKLGHWCSDVESLGIQSFNTIMNYS